MVRLHVLGPFEAHAEGTRLALGGPQQRAVLAMLVVARGSVVPAERIADRLWREGDRGRQMASLHPLVSNLRRVLEPGRPPRSPSRLILSAPPGYVLRLPEDSVDAWRFEAAVRRARDVAPEEAWHLLGEALGWWRGPAYPEWPDHTWAADEAARLDELRLMARELLLRAGLESGRAMEVVPSAEVLVREAPLREDAWRLLALALWAGGRQSEALAALRRARAVLVKSVGLTPGPPLVELERSILRGERDVLRQAIALPAQRPAPPTREATEPPPTIPHGSPRAPHAPVAPEAPGPRPEEHAPATPRPAPAPTPAADAGAADADAGAADEVLYGRTAELRVLRGAAQAAARRGSVAMVAGEAGSGKSTLLDHFGRLLRTEGWLVITGRCPENEGAPPAWAWVEALGELARLSPPATVGPLAALLHPGEPDEPPTADSAAGRFKVHTALKEWLASAAAEQPIALFVDDLHRADAETLLLLNCAAALRAPVLVVTAFRPDEAGERLGPLRAELARLAAYRITLRGLAATEVADLVRAVCGGPVAAETVAALTARTGGNPFFVTESARLLAVEGSLKAVTEVPEAIRDVLRLRLARRSAPERTVLALAAVCGRDADVDVLTEACELPGDQVVDALERCVRAGLLTEPMPGRVRFAHVLMRDVAYGDLTGLRRGALHGRLAEALERLRPGDLDALALHFARSGDPGQAAAAVGYAVRAAERAERRYAHDVAVDLLSQAIAAAERIPSPPEPRAERLIDLYGRLGRAQVRSGAIAAAQGTGERAVEEARCVGRNDLVAAAFAAWTEPTPWLTRRHWAADDDHVAGTLERLLAREPLPPAIAARLLQRLVEELADSGSGRVVEAAERQLAIARDTGDPALLAAAFTTMTKLMPHEHQAARCSAVVGELRELVRAHELPAYQWVCEHIDATIAAIGNDPEAVRRHTERGLAIARRFHIAGAEAAGLSALAMLAHARGEFDEAEAAYRRVRERLSGHNPWHGADIHTRGLITIRLNQGRVDEIEPHTRRVYETWGARGGEALALVLALQGKTEEARAVRFHRDPPQDHFYGVRLGARARLACVFDDREAAARLIPLLEPVQDQLGSAATTAFCTRPLAQPLGELYALLGDDRAARAAFGTAERVARLWEADHLAATARASARTLAGAR
ncbi:BTAD domain-containing putative transcriptional regulator [Streptomyces sp. NPDC046887]|uniref:BTAD domain-containing putative transcriptional regulator n=1 Tax=Streptomyces sp. NPDC046887 TaxID=3155472 RepID=UPI0033CABC2C